MGACSGEQDNCPVQEQKSLLHTRGELGLTRTGNSDWQKCLSVTSDEGADCESLAHTMVQDESLIQGKDDSSACGVDNAAVCRYKNGKLQPKNGQPDETCLPEIESGESSSAFQCMACLHYTCDANKLPPA